MTYKEASNLKPGQEIFCINVETDGCDISIEQYTVKEIISNLGKTAHAIFVNEPGYRAFYIHEVAFLNVRDSIEETHKFFKEHEDRQRKTYTDAIKDSQYRRKICIENLNLSTRERIENHEILKNFIIKKPKEILT